jgi:hypothetical protein
MAVFVKSSRQIQIKPSGLIASTYCLSSEAAL